MTERSESERAELVALNEWMREPDYADNFSLCDITDWINRRPIATAARLASQDQKPVAWRWRYPGTYWAIRSTRPSFADDKDVECEPLYLSPPPAAGWDDEATRYLKKIADLVDDENACDPLDDAIGYANKALEALRHNAPPDSGAGKSGICACLQPGGDPLGNCEICDPPPSVMPDHGGADAGVEIARIIRLFIGSEVQRKEYGFRYSSKAFDRMIAEIAALSKPAPVAANASAEARLREALEFARICIWNGCDTIEALSIIDEALSAHPHASDCARETEDDEWALRLSGDETTKSDETGIRVEDNHRSHGESLQQGPDTSSNPSTVAMLQGKGSGAANVANPVATSDRASHVAPVSLDPHASDCDKQGEASEHWLKPPARCEILERRPSDHTADVTVENIALVLLDGLKAGKAPIQISRALFDAFKVGRR